MQSITDADRYPLLTAAAAQAGFDDISDLALEISTVVPSRRLRQNVFLLSMSHVTPDAVELYGHGWCAMLAQAMNHHQGWPFVVLRNEEEGGAHVGVLTPRGEFLDILGERPLAEEIRKGDEVVLCDGRHELAAAGFGPLAGWGQIADGNALFIEGTLYIAEQLTNKAAERGRERRPV